jgi:hydroxymethylbilane synthase
MPDALIATRASRLARIQAEAVRLALAAVHSDLQLALLELETAGDHLHDISLEKVEGKGFFTDSLERALLAGTAQFAAHSLKDLPVEDSAAFQVAAVLPREDPRDVLVSRAGRLLELPMGARVGTDSSRRRAQILLVRPDLEVLPVRGNVPTRIAKLDRGEFSAIVLAAAGLHRLGLAAEVSEYLDPELCLPAPGQGAIAIQTLAEGEWRERALAVDDPGTSAAVRAERAFLAGLGGGCQAPVGALATIESDLLVLRGVLVEGGQARRITATGDPNDPEALGDGAARQLMARS